jgi:hypothetical protein
VNRRIGVLCLLASLIVFVRVPLCAEEAPVNVQGKWQASWQGRLGSQPITLELKQKGTKLSGQLLRAQGRSHLFGTVEGNQVSFDVNFSGPRPFTILFKGIVEGDSIKGTSQAQDVGAHGAYLGHGGEIVQPDHPWTAVREKHEQQRIAKSIQ